MSEEVVCVMQELSPVMERVAQEAPVPVASVETVHWSLFIVHHSVFEPLVELRAIFSYEIDVHEVMFACCCDVVHFSTTPGGRTPLNSSINLCFSS